MGTYKVIQDIEAEDKLLGPLTLKQFIFAILTLGCLYLTFLVLTRGVAFLAIIFLPPAAAFGILAWPWSQQQSTDIWLLAKIRFHIKPRRRIWDQSGIKDVVTITAPIKEERNLSDGLSEGEVKSRLKALASTIDSRGWAIKNVNVNLSTQPGYMQAGSSDRLIDISSLPQEVAANDITASDDILDEENNPTAQNLARMISAKASAQKQRLVSRLRRGGEEAPAAETKQQTDYWFLNQPSAPAGQAVFDGGTTVRPNETPANSIPTVNDQAALAQLQGAQAKAGQGNMRTLQPLVDDQPVNLPAPVAAQTAQPAAQPSGKTPDPAILKLARNDDLNVATIARQANKDKAGDLGDGEVVVPLR